MAPVSVTKNIYRSTHAKLTPYCLLYGTENNTSLNIQTGIQHAADK